MSDFMQITSHKCLATGLVHSLLHNRLHVNLQHELFYFVPTDIFFDFMVDFHVPPVLAVIDEESRKPDGIHRYLIRLML